MTITPLMFRVGMLEVAGDRPSEPAATLHESLPAIVEVAAGVIMHTKTRLTDVQRETTDDN